MKTHKKTDIPNKKLKKENKSFFSYIQWIISGLKENEQEKDLTAIRMTLREKITYVIGSILCILSCYVILSLVSYYFTGGEDQKLLCESADIKAMNWMGSWGAHIARYMIDNWFGVASIIIPIFLLATSIRVLRLYKIRLHMWFIHCTYLMVWFSIFGAFIIQPFFQDSFVSFGGQIGLVEMEFLREKIGQAGIILTLLLSAFVYLVCIGSINYFIKRKTDKEENTNSNPRKKKRTEEISVEGDTRNITETEKPFEDDPKETATTIEFGEISQKEGDNRNIKEKGTEIILERPEKINESEIVIEKPSNEMEVVVGKDPERATEESKVSIEPYDPKLDLEHYRYPTLSLLKKYETDQSNVDMDEQQANKNQIIEVLRNFGVEINSIKATIGPTITLYEITPAPGVRISKIRNLEDDIALSLRAFGIRIIAPIPGKGTIGIEVPNAKPQMVSMESILNSRKFQETDFELPMALGKTITNEVYMVDLAKMPHLLVAGATGQGKSVGLNAIISSLLYKKHPAELKIVMVDPKKVEFSVYSPIVNHFLAQVEGNEDNEEPIITDVNKVIQTLKSLCVEMDTRYDLLKKAGVRNIKEYNQKFKNRQLNPENGHKFMPYIVVIIDEFGDLIMTAGKEIELPIARIAQLARAVGIHMIIATQRPTTNIITGTIKANFPARMAFKVASLVDSRTILDRSGANQLVGKGDMLFLCGNDPVRVQCAFVDTPEVEAISKFIARQQSYNRPFPLPEVPLDGDAESSVDDVDLTHLDPMFEEVAQMVVAEQSGSTSMIQRKFSIGYNRAGRLMDQLEKAGIVGPTKGSKPREVLCISDDDLQFKLQNIR